MTTDSPSPGRDVVKLDVLRRLVDAADELEIRNVIAKIYLDADHEPDLAVYGHSFTNDVIWERVDGGGPGSHIGTRLTGLDQVLADRRQLRETGRSGPGSTIRHLITTLAVSLGAEGARRPVRTATAFSKFLVVDGEKPRPVINAVGGYEDALRRTDEGWKLCHRRYSSMSANR